MIYRWERPRTRALARRHAWPAICCALLMTITPGRAPAEVTLFGETLLPPTLLPVQFIPTSGVVARQSQTIGALQVDPGDYVIGGSDGNAAAVLVVTLQAGSATISPLQSLPSLDVHHAAGADNTGLVRDTLVVDGQVRFIGYSWSATADEIEATVWNGDVPTAYGFLPGLPETSELFAAADNGLAVGRAALRPVSGSATLLEQLPGPDAGTAVGIRADARLIVGEINAAPAFWRLGPAGDWLASENALDIPPGVFNVGSLYGARRHLVHGEAFHESGSIIGAVWDVNTGDLLQLFDPGTSVTTATTLAGHHVFAVNPDGGAPNPPAFYVHTQGTISLLDVFGGDLAGTGIDALTSITDIFPGSAVILGAAETASQGQYFIGAVAIHPPADLDFDGDVDADDVDLFRDCRSGPAIPHAPGCEPADLDHDNDVDQTDFARLQRSFTN